MDLIKILDNMYIAEIEMPQFRAKLESLKNKIIESLEKHIETNNTFNNQGQLICYTIEFEKTSSPSTDDDICENHKNLVKCKFINQYKHQIEAYLNRTLCDASHKFTIDSTTSTDISSICRKTKTTLNIVLHRI